MGIRVHDLLDPVEFREKLARNIEEKNFFLTGFFGDKALDQSEIEDEYLAYGERSRPFAAKRVAQLQEADAQGRNILFEGAQGTHLDIDHGTYPFVTSSNTVAGGACCGTGIGPSRIDKVLGVVKAYTTRVGGGPFPSELLDETGERIRQVGGEFGATTGRPRRCGWLDMVVVNSAVRLNGLAGLLITKLDVLSGIPKLKIGVSYKCRSSSLDYVPAELDALERANPFSRSFQGGMKTSETCASGMIFPRMPENTSKQSRIFPGLQSISCPSAPAVRQRLSSRTLSLNDGDRSITALFPK